MITRRTLLSTAAAAPAAGLVPNMLSRAHAQAQTPRRGGTLNVGVVSDPVTLDPAFMASFFEVYVFGTLHDTLLRITPDLQIEPGLATMTAVSPTVMRFDLRPNLKFHDDTPLDAAAVKWNFDRIMNPATASLRRADLGPLTSVEVTGPLQVTMTLSTPFAPFPHVMGARAGAMVSPTAAQRLGADFGTQTVGCGPFRLVRWTKNSELVLERFPGYWRPNQPLLDSIVYRPIPDETVRLTNLRSGALQLIDLVPPQAVAGLRGAANISLRERPSIGWNAMSLNVTRAPFADVKVRQALMYAVDRDAINRVVYFQTGTPAFGPIPPAFGWAHDAAFKPFSYDPARAQALLREAGVSTPVPFSITVTNSPLQIRLAQLIQAQANQAGFRAEIRQIDATSLITVLRGKDFDIAWSPWSGRSDPDGNTFNMFTAGGPTNFTGYASEKTTELLREARVSSDQTRRAQLYREVQQQLAADAPLLFFQFDSIIQASSSRLRWTQYPDGGFALGDAWLES
ncbi:MAG: peptide ABC transporter substrate-binding protein [Telmatospirillum sp.]|nr:peptide ABC transporter substrate-binding protein [Telmatospirillum sp.]